jgi:hypothetical protein
MKQAPLCQTSLRDDVGLLMLINASQLRVPIPDKLRDLASSTQAAIQSWDAAPASPSPAPRFGPFSRLPSPGPEVI